MQTQNRRYLEQMTSRTKYDHMQTQNQRYLEMKPEDTLKQV